MKGTELGAYSNTPHKTIAELVAMARTRARKGERQDQIVQDIVDGYNLGWQSANHRLIEEASKERSLTLRQLRSDSKWGPMYRASKNQSDMMLVLDWANQEYKSL